MDATFTLGRIKAKQVEGEATNDGEISAGVFHASAHLIDVQGDVKTPMNTMASRPEVRFLRPTCRVHHIIDWNYDEDRSRIRIVFDYLRMKINSCAASG
jgi:hypothetical protein